MSEGGGVVYVVLEYWAIFLKTTKQFTYLSVMHKREVSKRFQDNSQTCQPKMVVHEDSRQ